MVWYPLFRIDFSLLLLSIFYIRYLLSQSACLSIFVFSLCVYIHSRQRFHFSGNLTSKLLFVICILTRIAARRGVREYLSCSPRFCSANTGVVNALKGGQSWSLKQIVSYNVLLPYSHQKISDCLQNGPPRSHIWPTPSLALRFLLIWASFLGFWYRDIVMLLPQIDLTENSCRKQRYRLGCVRERHFTVRKDIQSKQMDGRIEWTNNLKHEMNTTTALIAAHHNNKSTCTSLYNDGQYW